MVYEYALDPALVATSTNRILCNLLKDSFGPGKGRLVSRFPGKWKKQVWQAFEELSGALPDTDRDRAQIQSEKERLTELIQRLSDVWIKREEYIWNPDETWLPNAAAEHQRIPFRAILTSTPMDERTPALTIDDLTDENERWGIPHGVSTLRKAENFSALVAPLLRCCQKAIFVDPHFNPSKYRYRQALGSFLMEMASPCSVRSKKQAELHCKGDVDYDRDFARECETRLPELIPSAMVLSIRRWKERVPGENFHNRYILTDIGGIAFGHGLDEGRDGQSDDLHLLDEKQYFLRWSQYSGASSVFDPDGDPLEIVGKPRVKRG